MICNARKGEWVKPLRLLTPGLALLAALAMVPRSAAQGRPYFVTYDHHLEEPRSLEIALNPVIGSPAGGNGFLGSSMEFEYGVTGWWTSELYLDGQSTRRESTLFTGVRWENRFRPLLREHWINPVLYVEFENLNGADKALLEVVGFDGRANQAAPNSLARREKLHEIETKLILSSNFRGWNVSENFIAEKNLNGDPWEFGYAAAVSRPLALAASPRPCRFCRENFYAGLEMYGGLGTAEKFTLSGTSHYLAPLLSWQ
ncbi:MAG TPA: hypothetical protein VGR03_07000, partial [Candidatus Acidoferrum sp.]|nr:hypothetical protein [Candidatus Acidoferrum sp.]